jgi:5-methylcytosine-specific restriction endonuclease McrA
VDVWEQKYYGVSRAVAMPGAAVLFMTTPHLDSVWLGTERRRGKQDIREAVIERDGLICRGCGKQLETYFEAQVDHKTPRAVTKRQTDADRLGNQQVLCTDCHRVKTNPSLTVARYMILKLFISMCYR